MSFSCGIVGLPNVGKSTLFNALTATAAAESANYPFCTIEPNVGRVGVPDERLGAIAKLANSAVIIPTQLEFVDIAGLVSGASKGEGLGNQFLGNIREVDAIIHVLRCFEDDDVTHGMCEECYKKERKGHTAHRMKPEERNEITVKGIIIDIVSIPAFLILFVITMLYAGILYLFRVK